MTHPSTSALGSPALALTPADLQAYIVTHGIVARLIDGLGETSTVLLAASALGVEPEQIIKSLLLLIKLPGVASSPQPVLVISNGERRVDYRAVGAHFGVSRKKVELAPADVVLAVLGYPAGGVPPLGHRTRVPVILDPAVLDLPGGDSATVYGGGGNECTMLEITVAELRRVVPFEVVDTSQVSPAAS